MIYSIIVNYDLAFWSLNFDSTYIYEMSTMISFDIFTVLLDLPILLLFFNEKISCSIAWK